MASRTAAIVCGAAMAVLTVGACSSSGTTATSSGPATTAPAGGRTDGAERTTTSTTAGAQPNRPPERGGTPDGSGAGSGPSGGPVPEVGLDPTTAEQLRQAFLNKGIDPTTADCLVNYVVNALQGLPVTQESLDKAVTDGVASCGSSAGGGGSGLVQGIIDNFPTGGPTTSTYP